MNSRQFVIRAARYSSFAAVLLFVPAAISLLLAIWSVISTGNVTVVSLGRTETRHEVVPWLSGWARLASPLLLLGAGAIYPSSPNASTLRYLAFSSVALSGVVILCYSLWFTTPRGALGALLFAAYIFLAYYVDAVYGRRIVTVLLVSTVAALVYVYAVA